MLGENIKKIRKLKGITQQKLAEKVGYNNRSMITHIEQGVIDLPESKIREIAKALNVSLSDLLEEKSLPKDPYYVDTSTLTEKQLTELNTIINMCISIFNSKGEILEHDRKMIIKVLTEAFINSLPNKK